MTQILLVQSGCNFEFAWSAMSRISLIIYIFRLERLGLIDAITA